MAPHVYKWIFLKSFEVLTSNRHYPDQHIRKKWTFQVCIFCQFFLNWFFWKHFFGLWKYMTIETCLVWVENGKEVIFFDANLPFYFPFSWSDNYCKKTILFILLKIQKIICVSFRLQRALRNTSANTETSPKWWSWRIQQPEDQGNKNRNQILEEKHS